MAKTVKSSNLNIYKLLSDKVTDFSDIVLKQASPPYKEEAQELSGDFQYKLFVQNKKNIPQWKRLIDPILKSDVFNSTSSFLLLVKIVFEKKDFFFALTGGYSHSLISKYIEDGFGLKIAEKTIDPKKIKNLTQTSFTGNDKQVIRAVAMYDPLYDPENQRRLLKSLEGKSLEKELTGLSVSGADSLKIRKKIIFDDLYGFFVELASVYEREENTDELWPRNFLQVKDDTLTESLNSRLIESLRKLLSKDWEQYSDEFYVGYKNFFDFLKCTHFILSYGEHSDRFDNLDIESIVSFFKKHDMVFDDHNLKNVTVAGFDEYYEVISETSLYWFIYSEVDIQSKVYFFVDGKWFLLLDAYKNSVDKEITKFQIEKYLPDYNKTLFPREREYNEWVSKTGDFVFMDGKLINKVEVCDLFKKDKKCLIHVKKGWGAKLSHLFAQGMVSGTLFDSDPNFKKKCLTLYPELGEKKKNNEYSVGFAIVSTRSGENDFPKNMTYFSKINLLDSSARLMQIGYSVVLIPVNYIP